MGSPLVDLSARIMDFIWSVSMYCKSVIKHRKSGGGSGGKGVVDLFSNFYSWVQKWQNPKVSCVGGGIWQEGDYWYVGTVFNPTSTARHIKYTFAPQFWPLLQLDSLMWLRSQGSSQLILFAFNNAFRHQEHKGSFYLKRTHGGRLYRRRTSVVTGHRLVTGTNIQMFDMYSEGWHYRPVFSVVDKNDTALIVSRYQ